MRVLSVLGLVLIALVIIGAIVLFTGAFDVAATARQGGLIDRILGETMDRSVGTRAEKLKLPDLAQASVPLGAAHFREMCETCHGGPGAPNSVIGRGLNPSPPDLVQVHDLEAREVYWIVRNGIRMTGMPAFGKTHTEPELLAITAFVLRLPGMSAAEYKALADSGEQQEAGEPDHDEDHPEAGRPEGTQPGSQENGEKPPRE